MTDEKGLKQRLKQWRRVSSYLKRDGFSIATNDGENFKVTYKKTPDCFVFVNVRDRCTIVTTPREKIPESMFNGQTTEWLYKSLYDALAIPFVYDVENDEIYSSFLLEVATDNSLFETVKLAWRGSFDYLCAVSELSEECRQG